MNSKRDLLPRDMPSGMELVEQGRKAGDAIDMRVSLFCQHHGVSSELEYKKMMAAEGRTMTSMTIGFQDWPATVRGLERVYNECERRGFYVDRYILPLDRRMGLPIEYQASALKETGPMLNSDADWNAVAQAVPIQPHLGDMMIGSPASLDNTRLALQAGVNYIGNLSQFAWKYPGWPGDDIDQMIEVVKSLGMMASKAEAGAVVHSYMDDGFPALFSDYCSYIGWARFERYIVESLIGAHLSTSYGGLTHDSMTKTTVTLALESLRPKEVATAFYYGNTTRYTRLIDKNYGVLGVDVLFMILADARARAGAAVMPVPVTEALRTPTADEIIEAQTIARQIADDADRVFASVDWGVLERGCDRLLKGGAQFFERLMNGLDDVGVDVTDPLQLLVAVRRLGARVIERSYGAGKSTNDPAFNGYQPVVPTDTLQDYLTERTLVREGLQGTTFGSGTGDRVVVGSTDVHEVGVRLVVDALEALGIEPTLASVGVDPDELADLALEADATALLVSTHNGMALSYAQQLISELSQRRLRVQIIFGGLLNQDVEGQDMPADVSDDLRQLGIHVCDSPVQLGPLLGRGRT